MPPRSARSRSALGGALALLTSGVAVVALAPTSEAAPRDQVDVVAPTPDCSSATTCTVTFDYVGAAQVFTVPTGISSVKAVVDGAAGGADSRAGLGGRTNATLPVDAGQELTVAAGQAGEVGRLTSTFGGGGPVTNSSNGSSSASGGGGSFVYDGNALLLAAGGGGGFSAVNNGAPGGAGGGTQGGDGVGYPDEGFYFYEGATGGSQNAGGTGGQFSVFEPGYHYNTTPGTDGTGPATGPDAPGQGGTGGHDGGRGDDSTVYREGGGGGGGGYYGGGAGGFYQGGGGGSGYLAPELKGAMSSGENDGDGAVTFTWDKPATTTTLEADPASGASTTDVVTLAATVEAADETNPTGTVAFTDDGKAVEGCEDQPLDANSEATCAATYAEGSHSFLATYSGSTTHQSSVSKPLSYDVVTPAVRNPEITATLSSDGAPSPEGWYRAPVTVSFTCTPGSAPVVSCPDPARFLRSGVRSLTRTVTAEDGGSDTVEVTAKVDRNAPRIGIRGARAGATYSSMPRVRCTTSERDGADHSSYTGCDLTRTVTATPNQGVRRVTWRAVAKDEAGNTTTKVKTARLKK